MSKLLAIIVGILYLTGCVPQPNDSDYFSAEIVENANITQTPDPNGAVLDKLKKGDEFLVFCKQDNYYAVPAPTGAAVTTWMNQGDEGAGFVPASAVKILGDAAPDCSGLLHGPDEHSKHKKTPAT